MHPLLRRALWIATFSIGVVPLARADSGAAVATKGDESASTEARGSTTLAGNPSSPSTSTSSVRAWLDLQQSGSAAGSAPRLASDAAIRVYRAYLESFSHPVPIFFYETSSSATRGTR